MITVAHRTAIAPLVRGDVKEKVGCILDFLKKKLASVVRVTKFINADQRMNDHSKIVKRRYN